MGKVEIMQFTVTAPKLSRSKTKALENITAIIYVFVHIQQLISGSGSIANVDARARDLDEILKGYPKGTIVGIDKLELLGDCRIVLP